MAWTQTELASLVLFAEETAMASFERVQILFGVFGVAVLLIMADTGMCQKERISNSVM